MGIRPAAPPRGGGLKLEEGAGGDAGDVAMPVTSVALSQASTLAPAQAQARPPKLWWEAQHLALPVCTLAGGPPVARHLAAASRAFHQAVSEAWGDLVRRFPCRLYVIGGLDSSYRPVDTAVRFDPLAGAWEALPPLGTPCAGPCAAAAAGKLYVLGGESSGHALREAQRFDPWVDRWEQLPDMHVGRIRAAAVECDGYLYCLGGLDGSRPLRSVERYDPRSRSWQMMPQMHKPRYACAAAAQGRTILVFGGELTDAGSFASMERFHVDSGVWELLPAVRAPGCGAALALGPFGQAAFTLGGLGLSGQALGVAERLALEDMAETPAPGTEEQKGRSELPIWGALPPMPTPRHLASAASFRGGAVAVGGKGGTFEAVGNVELFDPEVWGWEVLPALPSPRLRAAVAGGRL